MLTAPRSLSDVAVECAADPLLVQGAGGNVSLKDGEVFWVKASGQWMEHAAAKDVFVGLEWTGVQQWLQTDDEKVPSRHVRHNESLRPSIETSLHAAMPHRIVIHTHAAEVVSRAVCAGGSAIFERRLAGLSWAWIPYSRPGRDLTAAVKVVTRVRAPDVLILENHGLVVGGDTETAALDLTREVARRCRQAPRVWQGISPETMRDRRFDGGFRMPVDDVIHALARDAAALELCLRSTSVLYPDQAVFLGPRLSVGGNLASLPPKISSYAIVPDVGVLIANDADPMVEKMLRFHADILLRISAEANLKYLTVDEIAALLEWEPEQYRASLRQTS